MIIVPKAIVITKEEYDEIVKLRKANKDKNIDRRLHVLVLRFKGMSYEEIASITGKNVNTLKTNYHFATEKIKKYIKQHTS